MSTPMAVLVGTGLVLFVMRRPIARVLALLVVRKAVRIALTDVGEKALAKVNDSVTLTPDESYSWKNADIEQRYVRALQNLGFSDAGAWAVDRMPGVHIQILVHADDRIQANVYEHPQAGSWLELVSRYENGDVSSVTNLPSRGVDRPKWLTTDHVEPSTPAAAMVQQLLRTRKPGTLKPATPANAKTEFETGYAQFMAWKKKTGISPEEVVRQIERRAHSEPAGTSSGR